MIPACHVEWSDEDGEYVATCDQYPSLSWLDPNPTMALVGLRHVIRENS